MEVRLATPNDGPALAEIYRPFVEETAVSFETTAPDARGMSQRIADGVTTYPWLVAESESGVLGYAYAERHRSRPAYQWSVDVSVYVTPEFHRHGVGISLYEELLERLSAMGYRMAFAAIALPNDASLGFHRRFGFEPIGVYPNVGFKLGEWRDVTWMWRKLGDTTLPPESPAAMRPEVP